MLRRAVRLVWGSNSAPDEAERQLRAAPEGGPGPSDLNRLGDHECVLKLNAQISNFAVHLCVTDQKLNSAQVRAAYAWDKERGYKGGGAVFDVKNTHRQQGGATPWTADDEQKFLDAHAHGTMARRWLLLVKNTAGRIGDMHHIGSADEVARSNGVETIMFIRWQPKKKGSFEVQVQMSWELSLEPAGSAADAPSYLLTDLGRPFASSGSLDNRVRKWIVEAGLIGADDKANRSQHGIRKRRTEEIAEAGGTVYEVTAHLSHGDPKTSAIYTKRVERAQLAEQAVRRMEQASETQGVPRPQNRGATAAILTGEAAI